eukprot:c4726_g1_i1.p1 GENE.c4726_g1_i1~~c4726_g1_i1.p1  ORF type:complete len:170 (+),score=49.91 c4726_g1_i1:31-540(+)
MDGSEIIKKKRKVSVAFDKSVDSQEKTNEHLRIEDKNLNIGILVQTRQYAVECDIISHNPFILYINTESDFQTLSKIKQTQEKYTDSVTVKMTYYENEKIKFEVDAQKTGDFRVDFILGEQQEQEEKQELKLFVTGKVMKKETGTPVLKHGVKRVGRNDSDNETNWGGF